MEKPSTNRTQRIAIWVITITLIVGTLGVYFLIILQSKGTQTPQTVNQTTAKGGSVDPTAFKVDGKVTQQQIVDERVGAGAEVQITDTVRVHYKGTFAQTGQLFDSSYNRGEPA